MREEERATPPAAGQRVSVVRKALRTRARYRFDQLMSAGTSAQLLGLGLVAAVMIMVVGVVVEVSGVAPEGTGTGSLWYRELLHTLDPGVVSEDAGGWAFLTMMVFITFGGIFIVGALIGVISNGIDARLQELRKGRSEVLESNHIVVLGWSTELFTILRELVTAFSHKRDSAIVVLAPLDKVDMEDAIRTRLGDTGSTRIVCRTGDPLSYEDLSIVGLDTCRAIVVLTPEHEDDPDALVIKTLLAITNSPAHRAAPHHIVVELRDEASVNVGELAGRDQVEFLVSTSWGARIIAQTCRQPGLSPVVEDLLDFAGEEVYVVAVPGVAGLTFGEILHRFEDSCPLGLWTAEGCQMRPPLDTVVGADDRVIAISRNDESIVANATPAFQEELISPREIRGDRPERTLVLGRNRRLPVLLREFDRGFPPGSQVTLGHVSPEEPDAIGTELDELVAGLRSLQVERRRVNPIHRAELETIDVAAYDHVVILVEDDLDAEKADAHVIMTLLQLRDIGRAAGARAKVVAEMHLERNKVLALGSGDEDFIVSNQLMSEFIAQVVLSPELQTVFEQLFTATTCDLELRPVTDYLPLGTPVRFATAVEAAARRGHVAIGHKTAGPEGVRRTVLNPAKSTTVTYSAGDFLVVLAEGLEERSGSGSEVADADAVAFSGQQ